MIWSKHIGVALLVAVALTLLPFFFPGSDFVTVLHEPMLVFERVFKSFIPLNAGSRAITLFLANVGIWTVLVFLLGATWYGLKRWRAAPPI
jgi:hypothetical protein